jgi:hypothetical protein
VFKYGFGKAQITHTIHGPPVLLSEKEHTLSTRD